MKESYVICDKCGKKMTTPAGCDTGPLRISIYADYNGLGPLSLDADLCVECAKSIADNVAGGKHWRRQPD